MCDISIIVASHRQLPATEFPQMAMQAALSRCQAMLARVF